MDDTAFLPTFIMLILIVVLLNMQNFSASSKHNKQMEKLETIIELQQKQLDIDSRFIKATNLIIEGK